MTISFCFQLLYSRIFSMSDSTEVREFRVSSVLKLSFQCSFSSSILVTVPYMVSFTFRSPKGVPCVLQVSNRLSHVLMVSSTLSRKKATQIYHKTKQDTKSNLLRGQTEEGGPHSGGGHGACRWGAAGTHSGSGDGRWAPLHSTRNNGSSLDPC